MTFQLPFSASDCFVPLFRELDDRLNDLHLNTYGVSVTTMEEVFLNSAKVVDREFAHSLRNKRSMNEQGVSCAEGAKHLLVDQTEEHELQAIFNKTCSSDILRLISANE